MVRKQPPGWRRAHAPLNQKSFLNSKHLTAAKLTLDFLCSLQALGYDVVDNVAKLTFDFLEISLCLQKFVARGMLGKPDNHVCSEGHRKRLIVLVKSGALDSSHKWGLIAPSGELS